MEWITDRMPETRRFSISDEVLVTVSNILDDFHVVRIDRYDSEFKKWEDCHPEHDLATVTAWMPLPDPYQPNDQAHRLPLVAAVERKGKYE